MDRRQFLKWTGAASALMLAPGVSIARPSGSVADRVLVLVELAGGNDGLNTLVPYSDPAYLKARPSLAIERDQVLQLSSAVGLNPALEPLMAAWKGGDLAVLQGVGYPSPNRSHFRSIEIWETGSDSDETLQDGWLGRLLDGRIPADYAAGGVVLGAEDAGPLQGDVRAFVTRDPAQLIKAARRLRPAPSSPTTNKALAHILSVQDDLIRGAALINARHGQADLHGVRFPRGPFGQQVESAARLIIGGVPTAAIKISLGGFDTHAGQQGPHQRLLDDLGQGLAALRLALVKASLWDKVLIVTYSEFGRRVAENGSGGTDHGAASAHLALGGRVVGGLHGAQPSLTDLDGGDLKHTLDFRALYAEIARSWWGLPADALPVALKPTGFLK